VTTEQAEPCELLEWDTNFFGFRIARVRGDALTPERVKEIHAWCERHRVHCLYFLSRSDDAATTRLAEDNGFRLVDIRVTLAYKACGEGNVALPARANNGITVRRARPDDVPRLQAMARGLYRDTRFFYDANFPTHLSQSLYETWIRLSCEGYADAVFVAVSDDLPVGYVSCHLNKAERAGRIGLVGVGNSSQGHGVGQALIFTALAWLRQEGAKEITVVTQGRNCAAQRLYQRCGFLTQEVRLWYHKWYTLPGDPHEQLSRAL